jgi:hypothetical protein
MLCPPPFEREIGNCDIRMKAEHVKTTETTEEVSSPPGEKGLWIPKRHRNTALPEKNGWRTGKTACKSVERKENHEKGSRWSWARNQMGNVNL